MQAIRQLLVNKTVTGATSLVLGTAATTWSLSTISSSFQSQPVKYNIRTTSNLHPTSNTANNTQPSLRSHRIRDAFQSTLSRVTPSIPLAAADSRQPDEYYPDSSGYAKKQRLLHGGLTPLTWRTLPVTEILPITHDTSIYYFALDTEETFLEFPVSSFVYARANVNNVNIIRPYFPLGNTQGEMALMVKHYPDGPMSQVFNDLRLGDTLEFQGPIKKWDYVPNKYDRLTLIAGGTGITPMFQLIDGILDNNKDLTKVHLLFANKSDNDIPIREILDDLARSFPEQFKVTYVVQLPSPDWSGPVGVVDEPLLIAVAGEANPRHKVIISGPAEMTEMLCGGPERSSLDPLPRRGILGQLGYTSKDYVVF